MENPSVLFALAFCHHLVENLEKAMALYHKVLIKKYDTHFANTMLEKCFEDLVNSEEFKMKG